MAPQIEGNGRPRISFTLPTMAAICSIAGIFLWIGGFVMGYMAYTRSMNDLITQNVSLIARLSALEISVVEMHGDIKRTREDIAELKVQNIPKR